MLGWGQQCKLMLVGQILRFWSNYSLWIDRSHCVHYSVKWYENIKICEILILCKSICFITLSPEDKGEKLYKNQVPSGVSNNINMVLYGRMIKHQSCSFFLAWTEKDEQCLCSTGDNETRLAEIERSGHAQMLSKHLREINNVLSRVSHIKEKHIY